MTQLGLNSIYRATEGEGIHIGTPQVFVRFQGCTIGCVNCDSKETWDFDGTAFSVEQAMTKIEEQSNSKGHRIQRVSITGGDPLHPKHTPGVEALAKELKRKNFFVNIEAAGSRVVNSVFDIVDFVSFDFKTPSTGVTTNLKVLYKFIEQFGEKGQIKSVITDKKDFEFTYDILSQIRKDFPDFDTPWVLTPCYEPHEDFPKERFMSIIEMNMDFGNPFRVIGQQHKWIHGPAKFNV